MELVFFVARPDDAFGVCSSHDLPVDMAADPILADGPAALLGLAEASFGLAESPSAPAGSGASKCASGFRQLRDATCRSYPVWSLSSPLCRRLEALDEAGIDALAEHWQPHAETDAFDRARCLAALRDALRERAEDERLYALLEERAF